MPNFLWNPAWESGVEEVDGQHKELLRRMELLSIKMIEGGELAETERTLLFLRDCVEFHFNAEEALMRKIDYPGLAGHHKVHIEMRKKVNDLVHGYRHGHNIEPSGVMGFLVSWLIEHMNGEDRKMATFVRKGSHHIQ